METPPGSPPRAQLIAAVPHLIRRELGALNQVQVLERNINRLRANINQLQEQITPGRTLPRPASNKNLHSKTLLYSPIKPRVPKSKSSINLSKMR
jgi:hypothetical protein